MQSTRVTTGATKGKRPPRPAFRSAKKIVIQHLIPDRERAEVMTVLVRAALDPEFIQELTYHASEALEHYKLSLPAREALESGDLHWIEAHVGKLDPIERTWLDCRLQQEIW